MRKQSQRLFSARDRAYLRNRGIQAEKQLAQFRKGFPFVELSAPCTTGKGILKLSLEEQKRAEAKFLKESFKKEILKFVPASGAASRMFSFLEESKPEFFDLKQKFLKRLPDFAFYSLLLLFMLLNIDVPSVDRSQGREISLDILCGRPIYCRQIT